MSVQLQPSSQLGFQRPLTQLVKRTLSVTNSNSQPIAYKVKTTAPKQYCVRPNSGRIEPGETVEVQVLLQPMKEDPAPGTKCRDKFLVQSVIVTPDKETAALPDLWAAVEKEDKASDRSIIHEQKIRCIYLPAADEGGANGTIPEEEGVQSNSTKSPKTGSADDASAANPTLQAAESASKPPASQSSSAPSSSSNGASELTSTAGDAIAGAAAAVGLSGAAKSIAHATRAPEPKQTDTSAAKTTADSNSSSRVEKLQSELASAQAEIARLKEHLALAETNSATLRSRGVGAADKARTETSAVQAVATEAPVVHDGIPLQVVAGLVLGTFVLTWLFF